MRSSSSSSNAWRDEEAPPPLLRRKIVMVVCALFVVAPLTYLDMMYGLSGAAGNDGDVTDLLFHAKPMTPAD